MNESKPSCPNCNNENVAWILWGYVGDMQSIKEELEKGDIVLGGCIVSSNDPKWKCNNCNHSWGIRDDDE